MCFSLKLSLKRRRPNRQIIRVTSLKHLAYNIPVYITQIITYAKLTSFISSSLSLTLPLCRYGYLGFLALIYILGITNSSSNTKLLRCRHQMLQDSPSPLLFPKNKLQVIYSTLASYPFPYLWQSYALLFYKDQGSS